MTECENIAALKATSTINGSAHLLAADGGSIFFWTEGNFSGQEDGENIIASNSVALSTGAWLKAVGSIVQAERYGLSPSGTPMGNAQSLVRAIHALRTGATTISTDGLGSGPLTVYASGQLLIGEGVFPISPDVLALTQDLGFMIKGQGSRKTNNAVIGRTVLLITGTSSGFGIQVYGNGARGLVLEDLDLCYADTNFTGDCLDNFGSPGMTLNRVHIGTHGISGGTRLQTARSCLRSTYDEFIHCIDTTFDGAVDGWWSDTVRVKNDGDDNPIEFGGSQTSFDNCVWYDFTGAMIRHSGVRNRKGVTINRSSFNPISVNCNHAIDVDNIDGLDIRGGSFTPSTEYYAAGGWLKIRNCTGNIDSSWFGDLCPAGSLLGNIDFSNNFIGCTDGVTLLGGVITGHGNEFSGSAAVGLTPSGFIVAPTIDLAFQLGPDKFKFVGGEVSELARSYDIRVNSNLIDGHIIYSAAQDGTAEKFRNQSSRVTIRSVGETSFAVTSAMYLVPRTESGRTIRAEGSVSQQFTLPALDSSIGLKFRIVRNGSSQLTVTSPTAGKLYVGGGAGKTSIIAPPGDVGSVITVENLDGTAWNVTDRVGSFTFA
jgi:hypothetical protein